MAFEANEAGAVAASRIPSRALVLVDPSAGVPAPPPRRVVSVSLPWPSQLASRDASGTSPPFFPAQFTLLKEFFHLSPCPTTRLLHVATLLLLPSPPTPPPSCLAPLGIGRYTQVYITHSLTFFYLPPQRNGHGHVARRSSTQVQGAEPLHTVCHSLQLPEAGASPSPQVCDSVVVEGGQGEGRGRWTRRSIMCEQAWRRYEHLSVQVGGRVMARILKE